jgi:hypothetical protein
MKTLGTIMIVGGCLMCLTFILLVPGLLCIGVGALLRIAARKPMVAI